MPIGFTGGDGGSGQGRAPKSASSLPSGPSRAFPVFAEPVWPSVRDIAEAAIASVVETLVPVTVEVNTVRTDGRACPECGPYDGSLWDEGEGPQPPLHPNCRCRRSPHHTEWRTPR